jgi:ketosteroid isomerase-like protein
MSSCCNQEERADKATKLLDTDRAFSARSVEVGAVQAFHEFLAEDALMLNDGGQPVTGRETIFERMSKGSPDNVLIWEPQRAEVAKSGELGWTWGTFEYRVIESDTVKSVSHGKYLNVWRKDASENWKVLVDMGNSSPTPE